MKYIICRDLITYENFLKENKLKNKIDAIWINNQRQIDNLIINSNKDTIESIGPHFFGVTDLFKMAMERIRN